MRNLQILKFSFLGEDNIVPLLGGDTHIRDALCLRITGI